MAAAPDRPELTSVSPQFRDQLPDLAKTIGRSRLLQWQAQLRGTEQQLRQSVQPRLWLEVLLLGLLAEAPSAPTTAAAAVPAATPAAVAPAPEPKVPPAAVTSSPALPDLTSSGGSTNLAELWQQILGSLELPSTRMLLSQQGQLVRLDANRAVVQVAGNWMGMVQSRATLLEQAVAKALGGSRQLVLEASSGAVAPVTPPPPAPVVTPPAINTPNPTPNPTPEPTPAAQTTAASVATPQLPEPASKAPKPSDPSRPAAQTSEPSGLDRQAKNLADFFNGQVLDVESDTMNPG